jgi:hypothetical protein
MYFNLNKNALYGFTPNEISEEHRDGEMAEFERNLKTQPADWVYRTKKVIYQHNSYGHRSIEPFQLGENFFITIGCSNTYGQSLRLEDTWPYQLSKLTGMKYYNLGLGAAGVDITALNLSLWFKNIKLKPKAVIILWPESHRKFFKDEDDRLGPLGPWISNRESMMRSYYKTETAQAAFINYKKLIMTDAMEHYAEVIKTTTEEMIKSLEIKVVIANDFLIFDDHARDLKHPGIKSCKNLAIHLTKFF